MTRVSTSSSTPRPTKGPRVCRFIEKHCVLGEGDYFGQPVRLTRWQKRLIYRLYELNPDGSRRYRRALIGKPKGNGKTPFASWIGSYELAGGEHVSPIVPVGAASFEQGDLVFGDMKVSFRESPTLRQIADVYDTEIVLKNQPGRAFRVAAARGTNDGGRPSCYIADELHEFNDPAKEGAHLVLSNGTAKRANSLELNITTAGADLDSLLGRMYLKGRRIQSGEEVDDSFFFEWWDAPEDVDITDPDELRRAIRIANPAADDFLDVEQVAGRFAVIPEFEARRYYLNQWTRSPESWLPPGAWQNCRRSTSIPKGVDVYMACDMALFHDSTAVVTAWPHLNEQGEQVVTVESKIWEPVDGRIDHIAVKQYMRDQARIYNVREITGDPRFLELMFQELLDEGLPMTDFPQSAERMVPACGNAYELIVSQLLEHNGDATLTDHVLSAVQRPSDRGWILSKGRSKRKIDGAIALVMATWIATKKTEAEQPGELLYFS
jgi:phage terminase large subunit-like protein